MNLLQRKGIVMKKKRPEGTQPKPLSGSKKIKNKNHSRDNHGEGS